MRQVTSGRYQSSRIRASRIEALEPRHCLSVSLGELEPAIPIFESDVPARTAAVVQPSSMRDAASVPQSNQQITVDPGVQVAASIAVNPIDSEHVAIAYLDFSPIANGYAVISVAVSFDGGDSWQSSLVPLPARFDQSAIHPTVGFDAFGALYVSYTALKYLGTEPPLSLPDPHAGLEPPVAVFAMQSNNGIFVNRSRDGGITWESPIAIAFNEYNGHVRVPYFEATDMAIDVNATRPDGSSNPYFGTLYVTYTTYYPGGQFPGESEATGGTATFIATSSDQARSWQTRLQYDTARNLYESVLSIPWIATGMGAPEGRGYQGLSRITIGADGTVYVSDRGGGHFVVSHSRDGAASFAVPDINDPNYLNNFGLPFLHWRPGIGVGLTNSNFSVGMTRAIVADPTLPNVYYAAEFLQSSDLDIDIAISHTNVALANPDTDWSVYYPVNDDLVSFAEFLIPPRGADQFSVQLAAAPDGTIGMVWFDMRRDPDNRRIDVFAAIGKYGVLPEGAIVGGPRWRDGEDEWATEGLVLRSNFRVTDQSFDPDFANVIDSSGRAHEFNAYGISVAMANGVMYVVWSDPRHGNMDVFFQRVELNPPPSSLNDRFEPNDTRESSTILGPILDNELPLLVLAAGESDWFALSSATGEVTVTIQAEAHFNSFEVRLVDRFGTPVAGEISDMQLSADVVQRSLTAQIDAGETHYLQVLSLMESESIPYSLKVQSYIDLSTSVHQIIDGTVSATRAAYYRMVLPAAGAVDAQLSRSTDFQGPAVIEFLDPATLNVLATSNDAGRVAMPVRQLHEVYIRVRVADAGGGGFRLAVTNVDQNSGTGLDVYYFSSTGDLRQGVSADFNLDGVPDVAVLDTLSYSVQVSLANPDGTFRSANAYAVGAGGAIGLPVHIMEVSDFNGDGFPDIAVANPNSADVSVLLNRGDGTFAPQRRFDASLLPEALLVGDVNGDDLEDLVLMGSIVREGRYEHALAVLLSRGDGTFAPARSQALPAELINVIVLADVDRDGALDLVFTAKQGGLIVMSGDGDGGFSFRSEVAGFQAQQRNLLVADIDGDGNLDILETATYGLASIGLYRGLGEGRFLPAEYFFSGEGPVDVVLVDWGSEVESPDGPKLGPRDGQLDLVVAVGNSWNGFDGEIVVMPSLYSGSGKFLGFGRPQHIASAGLPADLLVADFDRNGILDIGVVDRRELFVIYGEPPAVPANSSQQTARNMGVAMHAVQPMMTITPNNPEAWYRLVVANEAVAFAGSQVLDFSAGFNYQQGSGLAMEVLDESGHVIGAGERLRLIARQSETLYVRIYAQSNEGEELGIGAYSLVVNTLPQVIAVEAESFLPGAIEGTKGPTTSLVMVFQGERLDPLDAENPDFYRVTWLGPDGLRDTDDDQVIPVGHGLPVGAQAVLYNPGGNIDVSSGRTYPTAVRQTVTLLFGEPLPPGSYLIEAAPLATVEITPNERSMLSPDGTYGHPLVTVVDGRIEFGLERVISQLVAPVSRNHDFSAFERGTRFLTQFHNDMGALLDALLRERGDDPQITDYILDQIVARFYTSVRPLLEDSGSLLVLFLDPVSISLVDPGGNSFVYDLRSNFVASTLPNTFVEVGGNVEIVVLPYPTGAYHLNLAQVTVASRGGFVYFGKEGTDVVSFTEALRSQALNTTFGVGPFSMAINTVADVFRQFPANTPPLMSPSLTPPVATPGATPDHVRAVTFRGDAGATSASPLVSHGSLGLTIGGPRELRNAMISTRARSNTGANWIRLLGGRWNVTDDVLDYRHELTAPFYDYVLSDLFGLESAAVGEQPDGADSSTLSVALRRLLNAMSKVNDSQMPVARPRRSTRPAAAAPAAERRAEIDAVHDHLFAEPVHAMELDDAATPSRSWMASAGQTRANAGRVSSTPQVDRSREHAVATD